MADISASAQKILDRARAHGGGPSENLPFVIAMCFGDWYLRRSLTHLADSENCPPPPQDQDAFLRRVTEELDAEEPHRAQAFRYLTSTPLPDMLFAEFRNFLACERLSRLQEELIQILVEQYYKESWTPDWLNGLAVELLAPVGGTFYDGVAGVGNTALVAAGHSKKRGGALQVRCQEISLLFHAISLLRIAAREFSCRFTRSNCLLDPITGADEQPMRYDWSVMFPPLGSDRQRISHIPSARKDLEALLGHIPVSSDWLFVFHQLASLNETGRGVCCVFSGLLFNERDTAARQRLLDLNALEAVVSLPANCLPFTAVPVSLLVLNRGRKQGEMVKMVDASRWIEGNFQMSGNRKDAPTAAALVSLIQAFQKGSFSEEDGVLIGQADLRPGSLLPRRYITPPPMILDDRDFGRLRLTDVSRPGWAFLKEAAEVYRGINTASNAARDDGGAEGVIKLSNVQDGILLRKTVERYTIPDDRRLSSYRVAAGDILISCKGPAIKLCLIPPDCGGLLMSLHFLGLRIRREVFDPEYVYYFLQSPLGQVALRRCQVIGSSIPMIRAKDLEELQIPYIPLADQTRCAENLRREEALIAEQMDALRRREQQARWTFYTQIGLTDVMQKED